MSMVLCAGLLLWGASVWEAYVGRLMNGWLMSEGASVQGHLASVQVAYLCLCISTAMWYWHVNSTGKC